MDLITLALAKSNSNNTPIYAVDLGAMGLTADVVFDIHGFELPLDDSIAQMVKKAYDTYQPIHLIFSTERESGSAHETYERIVMLYPSERHYEGGRNEMWFSNPNNINPLYAIVYFDEKKIEFYAWN